jgi:hypothetical protein
MALEQLSSGLFATQRHFSPVVALKQLSLGFMGCYLLHRDTSVLCGPRTVKFGVYESFTPCSDISVLHGPRTVKFGVS